MNADCWSHISTFLSLNELIISRLLDKEIHMTMNKKYYIERHKYLNKCALNEMMEKIARKDWIHRSPLLCCFTNKNRLMSSRYGYVNKLWDPPLMWQGENRNLFRNCLYLDSNIWGSGEYIDSRFTGWNQSIWENRMKLNHRQDCILGASLLGLRGRRRQKKFYAMTNFI